MIGNKLTEYGRLINNRELMLVHIQLEAGGSVPAHDHCGQDVFFTVVRGTVDVTLGGTEIHTLSPGSVLHFPGESSVSVQAAEAGEFFVYLINRRD